MRSVEWPDSSGLKILDDILGEEPVDKDNKDERYRKAFKKLISGCNEEKFKELIDKCLDVWKKEIQYEIKKVDKKYELLAYSLHYKSPGLGQWFRWPVILEKEGTEIFKDDIPLLDIFAEKYLQIPQVLNVSLDNENPEDVFNNELILEIQNGGEKIKIDKINNIVLPIETIIKIDNVLREKTINTIIDEGRKLIVSNGNGGFNGELKGLNVYFQEDTNNTLNAPRLLLSGYLVFRFAKKIKEYLTDKNKKLVIIFFPMKGIVSAGEKEGSWFIFLSVDKDKTIDIKTFSDLRNVVSNMWSLIRGHDINAITHSRSQHRSLDVERLIGELVYINKDLVNQENKAKEWIIKSIDNTANVKKTIESLKWPDKVEDKLRHFIGGNKNFIEFLEKLKKTAELGRIKKNKKSKPEASVISIFLYSEPGTGKETLSYLIHLWARCQFMKIDSEYCQNKKQLMREFINENKEHFVSHNAFWNFVSHNAFWNVEKLYEAEEKKEEIKNKETKDGFFIINCPLLTRDNFSKLVFGTLNKPNGVLKATAYAGTCFFDEFNTLEKGLANNFLRLLAKPYESLVFESEDKDSDERLIKNFNCVYVFASNKTPDELIDEGFNEAVISRISQYYFEVPPLRQRTEDMLLAFINGLTKKEDVGWKKIEPTALRFLCLLPWEGNFRTLAGFVDDLYNERRHRGISAELMTFQEVVECAVRRKLIGG